MYTGSDAEQLAGRDKDDPTCFHDDVDAAQVPKVARLVAIELATGEGLKGVVQHEGKDGCTKVFLMPGGFALGDYDQSKKLQSTKAKHVLDLARFRYALRDQIEFILIGYPDWREMIASKVNFGAIIASAFEQIQRERYDGPIYIAGHSFGGLVAFATAYRLVEAGRQVAFVGMFDSRLPFTKNSKNINGKKKWLRNPDSYKDVLLRLILRNLLRIRAFLSLELFAKFCISIGMRHIGPLLLFVLREYAVRAWKPNALSVPTFFFRTEDDDMLHQAYDCGWNALCSRLTVVPIGGEHDSILAPAHLNHLCARFLEAVRTAEGNCGLHVAGDPGELECGRLRSQSAV